MRQYIKSIVLAVVLIVLIVLAVLVLTNNRDLVIFKTLSIAGIQKETSESATYNSNKATLDRAKNSYDVAKEQHENIDESKRSAVEELNKETKYFIEYLWIVLGNYATVNKVDIDILTPGATYTNSTTKPEGENKENAENPEGTGEVVEENNVSSLTSGIKITIRGRYADVADFVFDVENDKSLRFKLDNINMVYAQNNTIQATFDVLSLSVLQ